ncbi:copper chaperone PCu(A)C [Seohaeicola nanhaiensis]|uniref:Copper chaperone PCu(A)C n=1 Tax=Seohaeicola nanhaiensis TaxID=1387282 RepID=A0ABV9KLF9_9RHOB
MLISDVRASATEEGGSTRLTFRIENATGRTQILDAVRSDDAEEGSLVVIDDGVEAPAAAGLLMLDHETLNLGTSHIRVLLHGLKRPLKEGDVIAFQAVFRDGTVPAQGHVHATINN